MIAVDTKSLVCGLLALAGIVQFAASVQVAIGFYPPDYAGASSYRLAEHFLSDLGCTRADQRDNTQSSQVFNRSVILLGLSLFPFLLNLPNMERGRSLAQACGACSALGLIGIGLTPYDLYFVAHHVALVVWLLPLPMIVIAYLLDRVSRPEAPRGLALVSLGLLAALSAYALAGSHSGYVIFQKVTAVAAVSWFLLVASQVSIVTFQSLSPRQLRIERQAEQYLKVLERGHRRR